MATKISKADAKTPDKVLKTLNEGFQWSQTHSKLLGLVVGLFLVVGIGYSIFSTVSEKKESEAQTAYFKFEKSYLEKKRDFEEAGRPLRHMGPKEPEKKAAATGELDKDYGPEVAGFQEVLTKFPSSKAAQMAALNLSEIYLNYKKADDALQALQKVEPSSHGTDLISSVVLAQMGNVLTAKDDCKGAIDQWQKVLNNPKADFMHDALRMKSAFCFEKLNDLAKAEELYRKVAQGGGEKESEMGGGLNHEAEKFLRLLKLKNKGS